MSFQDELELLINKHSRENASNTPDFILAAYLSACLLAFERATESREDWYKVRMVPGRTYTVAP